MSALRLAPLVTAIVVIAGCGTSGDSPVGASTPPGGVGGSTGGGGKAGATLGNAGTVGSGGTGGATAATGGMSGTGKGGKGGIGGSSGKAGASGAAQGGGATAGTSAVGGASSGSAGGAGTGGTVGGGPPGGASGTAGTGGVGGGGSNAGNAGTSGIGGSAGAPGNTLDVASCTAWWTALCDAYPTCLPLDFELVFESVAACKQWAAPLCNGYATLPGITLSATQLKACAASLATSCDDFAPAGPCFFSGALPAGGDCLWGAQCGSGFCSAGGEGCGHCIGNAPPTLIGDPCTSSCAVGQCLGGVCKPAGGEGQACDPKAKNLPCKTGFLCLNAVCSKTLGLGAACDPAADLCEIEAGLRCDSNTKLCAQAIVVVKAGDACAPPGGMPVTYCQGTLTCSTGTCKAPKALGEPCSGAECGAVAGCLHGTCKVVDACP